jgi:hypothetical protein
MSRITVMATSTVGRYTVGRYIIMSHFQQISCPSHQTSLLTDAEVDPLR